MPTPELPERPSLENLKKQAKSLLKAIEAGDAQARSRLEPYFADPASVGLQQVQLVLARDHGFSSWSKLKRYLEGQISEAERRAEQRAAAFLRDVVITYSPLDQGNPGRFEKAKALLEKHPEIRRENIFTAAAIGDAALVEQWLNDDPSPIDRTGGYHDWEPLMYAAYARLPGTSTFEAAKVLIGRGANPNAFRMWHGQYKFTALTGAFGRGEGGPIKQPEHPDFVAFARLLLDAGANANDSQAAYNRMFEPDDTCLELLLEYGINADDKNNWLLDEADKLVQNPSETLHYQLIQALRSGKSGRARLLIDNGVALDKPDDTYETSTKGKTPHETALMMGNREIADYLLAKGAKKAELSLVDALQGACMAGDGTEAQALLKEHPELAREIQGRQNEMLVGAVELDNEAALTLMIDLGFDLNDGTKRTPLQQAALQGKLDLVKLLIDRGADPALRNPTYFGSAIGFAQHGEHEQVVAYLDDCEMDIFTAASRGKVQKLQELLAQDPDRLETRFSQIRPKSDGPCEVDWATPLVFAVTNDRLESVAFLLQSGANAKLADDGGKTLLDLARETASSAVVQLIEKAKKV